MLALELAMVRRGARTRGALRASPLSAFAFSSAASRLSVSTPPSWATFASNAFSRSFMVRGSWRTRIERTPKGETSIPRFFSSLDARVCPQAGCSVAIATTASSTSGATRFFRFGLRRVISTSAISPPCS